MRLNAKTSLYIDEAKETIEVDLSKELLYLQDLPLEIGKSLSKRFYKNFSLKETLPGGN